MLIFCTLTVCIPYNTQLIYPRAQWIINKTWKIVYIIHFTITKEYNKIIVNEIQPEALETEILSRRRETILYICDKANRTATWYLQQMWRDQTEQQNRYINILHKAGGCNPLCCRKPGRGTWQLWKKVLCFIVNYNVNNLS